ncbi:NAD(P)/FAD-dependent oxidoreductase [Streptomyces sp. NPDC048636]|uniref:FAD-dependent oxidoreductase n=1 Tax=Streptomyces sp. NPDC048636 TaxID=3155762 RepID=UPI00341952B5
MAHTPFRVLIIGAGTGGLCLAHGLRQAGIPVTVFERDATRRDGLHGYRVGIDPDGSRALHDCLPKDLFDTFVATCARTPTWSNQLTEQRKELLALPSKSDPDMVASERSVSRMTLRQVLLTGLGDTVRFGKTFTRYTNNPDATVTAHFEDGTSATADVLVAADGTNSRVRRQYLPHARLEPTGLIGVTGKVPLDDTTRLLLTERMLNGVSLVIGPNGNTCVYHAMRFPWHAPGAPKDGIGSTDAALISNWPGMQFDNTRDYIMWGFAAAAKDLPPDILDMNGTQLQHLVRQRTASWHPDLRKLFALADPNSCFPLNIRTSVPIQQWVTTNVTLLGDAIHTMTPGRGVGANTALRDARLLTRNLTAARDGHTTVLEAIHAYETKMLAYSTEAVTASLQQMTADGAMYKPVIGRAALAGMRTAFRVINRVPPLKRRIAASFEAFRNQDED